MREELEKLQKENEYLRNLVKDLRRQLELYQRSNKRNYAHDRDHLPYQDDDRDR